MHDPVLAPQAKRDFSVGQLALIRRSVCRSCTDTEFDEFIAVARDCELDPLRRQIAPLIVNEHDGDKRRLIPWTTIDGLRLLAARHGDYRPMETPPVIDQDDARIDEAANPLGLVRAEVRVWKRDGGAWHPIVGEAWWDEFAPLRPAPAQDAEEGAARLTLDPSWARMGRVMLAKCAEAQALRRGWPDTLSGLYTAEELHLLTLRERAASQRLAEKDARRQVCSAALWFSFGGARGLSPLRQEEIFKSVREHYQSLGSEKAFEFFDRSNKASLALFWERAPDEAMALKRFKEERLACLSARSQVLTRRDT